MNVTHCGGYKPIKSFWAFLFFVKIRTFVVTFLKTFGDTWKFFWVLGDSFYTVNTQNLQEFKRIYKGQKSTTKGFFWILS